VTWQVLLPSTLTSLSAYEVTYSTMSCFLGLYACSVTDGDFVAIFLTENFPLITPGTPIRAIHRLKGGADEPRGQALARHYSGQDRHGGIDGSDTGGIVAVYEHL
jgi:hypothetical protein